MRITAVKNEFLKRKCGVLLKIVLTKCYPYWIAVSKTKTVKKKFESENESKQKARNELKSPF